MREPSQFSTSLWGKIGKTELDEQQQNGDCEVKLINVHEGNKTQEAKKQQSLKKKKKEETQK